jgi:hypothetical protein
MSLKLTPTMVNELRTAYGAINCVDPASGAYFAVCEILDSLSQEDLETLRDADIKWVSSLADERVML